MQKDDQHEDTDPNPTTFSGVPKNDLIHMKILVPSGAVGAIIGKGGRSIVQIQAEAGARIKLSKLNDFYPGTTERVCLIQGTLDGITRIHNYIMDRMLEKPDCAATQSASCNVTVNSQSIASEPQPDSSVPPGSRLVWGRHQQVKILVPNCTAGLVIGKMGSYIKEIKDQTKAFIQISQKSKEINLLERCITIAGEPDQCRAAVALVLAKIAEDPQSTSCPTISYSRVQGPVANAHPSGSPFAFAASFPRHVTPVQSQHSRTGDRNPSYMALLDPYVSPMIQAAWLQAAANAMALDTHGYYTPQHSPLANTSFTGAATAPQPLAHAPPQLAGIFDVAQGTGGFVPSNGSCLYGPAQPHEQQPGSIDRLIQPSLMAGQEFAWNKTGTLETSPSLGCIPTAFDAAYQNPFTLAYYAANQTAMAPFGPRSVHDSFHELYSPPAYAPVITLSSHAGFRTIPTTPVYTSLYSQTPTEVVPNQSKMMNVCPTTIALTELFGSLRIGPPGSMDYTGSGDMRSVLQTTSPGVVTSGGFQQALISHPGSLGEVQSTVESGSEFRTSTCSVTAPTSSVAQISNIPRSTEEACPGQIDSLSQTESPQLEPPRSHDQSVVHPTISEQLGGSDHNPPVSLHHNVKSPNNNDTLTSNLDGTKVELFLNGGTPLTLAASCISKHGCPSTSDFGEIPHPL